MPITASEKVIHTFRDNVKGIYDWSDGLCQWYNSILIISVQLKRKDEKSQSVTILFSRFYF